MDPKPHRDDKISISHRAQPAPAPHCTFPETCNAFQRKAKRYQIALCATKPTSQAPI